MEHKAGYVSIVGKPNAGKSTLLNALLGEQISIVSPKVQTTRHRILGMLNDNDCQIIFSDTPGIIEPMYPLHRAMMNAVDSSLIDADLILLLSSIEEVPWETPLVEKMKRQTAPVLVVLNKIDLSDGDSVNACIQHWNDILHPRWVVPISATNLFNLESVLNIIKEVLPEHPAYFDKDDLSDRSVRFFVAERIREKILFYLKKEIPYSAAVVITDYKEKDGIDVIQADIVVERESQKVIVIGKDGEMLKKIGTSARIEIEKFLDKKVFLDLTVKVVEGWKHKEQYLKKFGYE